MDSPRLSAITADLKKVKRDLIAMHKQTDNVLEMLDEVMNHLEMPKKNKKMKPMPSRRSP